MKLQVDRHAATPMAQQLEESLRQWIQHNGAGGGLRLPSIRRLAATHNISRNAVIDAYERLVSSGLIRSKPGSGFYVADSVAVQTNQQRASSPLQEVTNGLWGLFGAEENTLKLGCGWLPNTWRESDDLTYAIRQVTRHSRSGIFEYSTPHGLLTLRRLLQRAPAPACDYRRCPTDRDNQQR